MAVTPVHRKGQEKAANELGLALPFMIPALGRQAWSAQQIPLPIKTHSKVCVESGVGYGDKLNLWTKRPFHPMKTSLASFQLGAHPLPIHYTVQNNSGTYMFLSSEKRVTVAQS